MITVSDFRKPVVPALVASAIVGLSLAQGAYAPGVYAGATIVIWWTVIVGLLFGACPRSTIPGTAIAAGACLATLALTSFLSIAWASDHGQAFAEATRTAGYAGLFVLIVVCSRAGDARSWLAGLAIGIALIAVIALLSRLEPHLPGGDEEIARLLPAAKGRLSYPIGYWNGLAALVAAGAVLLTWFGAAAHSRGWRAVSVAALPLCALAIYLTSSRGALAAGLVGLTVLVAVGPNRAQQLGGLAVGGAGAGLLVLFASRQSELLDGLRGATVEHQGTELLLVSIAVFAAVGISRWALDGLLQRATIPRGVARGAVLALVVSLIMGAVAADPVARLDEFNDPPKEFEQQGFVASHLVSSSGTGRYQFWTAAIDAFEAHPIKGLGAGEYVYYWNQHGSIQRSIRDAHSLLFESLAELGLVGFALLLGFVAIGPFAVWARRRHREATPELGPALALLATGVVSAATEWTWELPVVFGLVIIASALLTGPATLARATDQLATDRRGLWAAAVVAAAVSICAAGIVFITELKIDASRDAAGEGDLAAAARAAEDARAIEPWSSQPRLQLALVDEERGDLRASRAHLREASDRAPQDWLPWLALARIEVKAGRLPAAEAALERARELNPKAPLFTSAQSTP